MRIKPEHKPGRIDRWKFEYVKSVHMLQLLALTPLMVHSELDFSNVGGVPKVTAANVGYIAAAVLPCSSWLPAGLDLHTLAKCPFFYAGCILSWGFLTWMLKKVVLAF